MRGTGLEPACLAALAPKASASANSAIPAQISFMVSPLAVVWARSTHLAAVSLTPSLRGRRERIAAKL